MAQHGTACSQHGRIMRKPGPARHPAACTTPKQHSTAAPQEQQPPADNMSPSAPNAATIRERLAVLALCAALHIAVAPLAAVARGAWQAAPTLQPQTSAACGTSAAGGAAGAALATCLSRHNACPVDQAGGLPTWGEVTLHALLPVIAAVGWCVPGLCG